MLGFCRIYVRLKIKKEQKTCFKILDKERQWERFMLRVRGLQTSNEPRSDIDFDSSMLALYVRQNNTTFEFTFNSQ